MKTPITRWDGKAWEIVPQPLSGHLYTVTDPATGQPVYFETRQERDAWLAEHEVSA